MHSFLQGALMMGNLILMLLLLRSWRDTRDSLFLWFGLAFGLLAVERTVQAIARDVNDRSQASFLIRLAAHVLILVAIARKNYESRPADTKH